MPAEFQSEVINNYQSIQINKILMVDFITILTDPDIQKLNFTISRDYTLINTGTGINWNTYLP
jgi:hypothetical protein